MKILLINLPPVYSQTNKYSYRFPLGITRIAQVLKANGHSVVPLDLVFCNMDLNDAQVMAKILSVGQDVDLIGIGGLVSSYHFLTELIPVLRQCVPGRKIIIGGGIASEIPQILLQDGLADYAVIGEGEVTILDLMRAIDHEHPLEQVKGIAFLEEGEVVTTPPQEVINDLSQCLPDYSFFDVQEYIDRSTYMRISTSRGCPNQCHFCYSVMGKRYRTESIDNVIERLKGIATQYEFTNLSIVDQLFLCNKDRVTEFCNRYIEMGAPWKWHCSAYAGFINDKSEPLLALMKEANCASIGMGIETGSQTILDNMNKGILVERIKIALKMIDEAGIVTGGGVIFGYPGENRRTVDETIRFFDDLPFVNLAMYHLIPFIKTRVFKDNREKILEKYGTIRNYVKQIRNFSTPLVNLSSFSDDEYPQMFDYLQCELKKRVRSVRL